MIVDVLMLPVHPFNIFLRGVFTDLEDQAVFSESQILSWDETVQENVDSLPERKIIEGLSHISNYSSNLTEKGIVTTP